jgi:dihydrofolate synthase/folylpolyglutamate synthase
VLEDFLDKKPLFYDEIDYGRMPRIYKRISSYFDLRRVIHIVGTNGKGTTGRFLATALYNRGYNTGHYTSPHIRYFNERIWFNGSEVSMEVLNQQHQELLKILTQEEADSLSYFEYTTLLAMFFFSKESDFVVLEAGLGGEHDATAVFENELTLVTPIAKDHEAFLGNTIEMIAKTKLAAIQKTAILAPQEPAVYYVCDELKKTKDIACFKAQELLTLQDHSNIETIAAKENLADYLKSNLGVAVAALKYFNIAYEINDFENARLFGRLTALNENIIIDVGHNVLAAEAIVKALKGTKYRLVYNSYKDKNYREILKTLRPLIQSVAIIDVDNVRLEDRDALEAVLNELAIEWNSFEALEADENYLVFGSFSVVEAFLEHYNG